MKANPYTVVKDFEKCIAEYTGAPYAISVDSCTNALFLCCKYLNVKEVTIPARTYLSVPMSIIHSGADVVFDKTTEANHWSGIYQLKPYPIWDSCKRMKKDMYIKGSYMTLSFHHKKHLKIGKGGAILCDNKKDYEWFKRARFMGRGEISYHDDEIDFCGWNMYMTPNQAVRGLELLSILPNDNEDHVENPPYRDLTTYKIFNK